MFLAHEAELVEFNNKKYSQEHGSPFDRGAADSYYGRGQQPHWYPNGTGNEPRITALSDEELDAYYAGYAYNERFGDKKQWY